MNSTEAALEKEGISVAPPKRARAPSATLPPRPVLAHVASVREVQELGSDVSGDDESSDEDNTDSSADDRKGYQDGEGSDDESDGQGTGEGSVAAQDDDVGMNDDTVVLNDEHGDGVGVEQDVLGSGKEDDVMLVDDDIHQTPKTQRVIVIQDSTPRGRAPKRQASPVSPTVLTGRRFQKSQRCSMSHSTAGSRDSAALPEVSRSPSPDHRSTSPDYNLQGASKVSGGVARGKTARINVGNMGTLTLSVLSNMLNRFHSSSQSLYSSC